MSSIIGSIRGRNSRYMPPESSQSISSSSVSFSEEENLDPGETLPYRDNYALMRAEPSFLPRVAERIDKPKAECKPRSHSAPEYLHNVDKITAASRGRQKLERLKSLADIRKKKLTLPKGGPVINFFLLQKDPLTKQTFYDLFVNDEKRGKPLSLAVVKFRNKKEYSFFYGEQLKFLLKYIPSSSYLKKMKTIYWFSLRSLNDSSFAYAGKTDRPRFKAILNRKKSLGVF